jgi:hypothetical protein
MKNEEQKILLSRPVELIIGIGTSIISILLILLCVFIFVGAFVSNSPNIRQGFTLFAIPASFAIFFSFVSINLIKRNRDYQNPELMSLHGWRVLAGTLFGLGLIVLLFGKWFGAVLPVTIGALSLFKEPRIRKWYQALLGA